MSIPERILFGLYVLAGPVAWGVVALLVRIGRFRMNKLQRLRDPLPAVPPLVSILIPAKDEAVRIGDCIEGVLRQDYPAFEVVAVDDRSTDDTGSILDGFAAGEDAHAAVRVVHVETLPPGWLGKCHALDAGGRHAAGEWLLFVDSDVRLRPDALTRLAALAIARDYHAISILTTIETHTFVERLMLPLLAGTWMTMFLGDQTNEDSEPDKALANGQVFLIRADAYAKVGGHAAVKDRIVEDVELMRLLKKTGHKVRFFSGPHLAATRMHTHLPQMFNGWARIFAGTARGRVWPMLAAIAFLGGAGLNLACAAGWAVATGSLVWAGVAVLHAAVMLGIGYFVWLWSGNPPAYALLLPLSIPVEVAILIYAVRKAISGKIDWRGSAVDLRKTSRVIESPPV